MKYKLACIIQDKFQDKSQLIIMLSCFCFSAFIHSVAVTEHVCVPVFSRRRSVPLSSVFEPVAHLSGCESRGLSQMTLSGGVWIGILQVPFPQEATGSLLKTQNPESKKSH